MSAAQKTETSLPAADPTPAKNEHERNWLAAFWRKSRRLYTIIIVISFFLAILAIAAPVYVLQVYDRVVFQGGLTTLQALVIGMLVVVCFDFTLKVIKSRIFSRISLHIDFHLGQTIYDQLNRLPLQQLESKAAATWHQLFQDQEKLRNLLSGHFAGLMIDLPFAFLGLAIIGYMSLPLMIMITIIISIFLLLAAVSSWMLRRQLTKLETARQDRHTLLSEMILGRTTIKSLSLKSSFIWRWQSLMANNIDMDSHHGKTSDVFQSLATSLTMMSTVVTTAFGALLILDQQLTIGVLIASNMLSSRLLGNMTQLVTQWRMLHMGREAWARLDAFFAFSGNRPENDVSFPAPEAGYSLKNIEFSYNENTVEALIQLPKVDLPHQGLITVLGNNGSGKTTLLKLLAGLYAPSKGQITLDNADLSQFSQRQLSRWIGYLPQEIVLFSGSVFENIAMGGAENTEINDEKILLAAKKVGVHDDIVAHANGYLRELGEGGSGLSGGQRQKLCIARLLVDDKPILLLDEPTSQLDRESCQKIALMLAEYSKTHLVVVVSHHQALINVSDTLIGLEKGRLAWAGPRDQVLKHLQEKAAKGSKA